MLLLTVVYNSSMERITDEVSNIKKCFEHKNMILGIGESIIGENHVIKLFCSDDNLSYNNIKAFNLHFANILYKMLVLEFCRKEINIFLTETYFFLRYDELKEVKPKIQAALICEGEISGPCNVYFINKKNIIIDKIAECIEENNEININGFLTFRMKELKGDLECIVDKAVEEYMVEKEYNEFIKLLKYFVEAQESKVEEVNIIVEANGNYKLKDEEGNDLLGNTIMDLPSTKFDAKENQEELIISSIITNAPKRVIIHCAEFCKNKELIQTISSVFVNRVYYCDKCSECMRIKRVDKQKLR